MIKHFISVEYYNHYKIKARKSDETLTGRLIYDAADKYDKHMDFLVYLGEFFFSFECQLENCRNYHLVNVIVVVYILLLENDIVQFIIAKDKRDGMMRATQIALLDQSFLKSKEQRQMVGTEKSFCFS